MELRSAAGAPSWPPGVWARRRAGRLGWARAPAGAPVFGLGAAGAGLQGGACSREEVTSRQSIDRNSNCRFATTRRGVHGRPLGTNSLWLSYSHFQLLSLGYSKELNRSRISMNEKDEVDTE